MRESDIEELATHGGPEPCVVVREGGGEASVGVRAGRAIEPRNLQSGVPTPSYKAEGNIVGGVFASRLANPAGSKNLGMYGVSGRENREIPRSSARLDGGAGRAGKAEAVIP